MSNNHTNKQRKKKIVGQNGKKLKEIRPDRIHLITLRKKLINPKTYGSL